MSCACAHECEPRCDQMDVDERYPLPPPLGWKRPRPGKRYPTQSEYDEALAAWIREDQTEERQAMRRARAQHCSRARQARFQENSAANANRNPKRTRIGLRHGLVPRVDEPAEGQRVDEDEDADSMCGSETRRQRRHENYATGAAGLPVGGRHNIDRMPRLAALRPIPATCRTVGRSGARMRMGFPDAPTAADVRNFRNLVRSDTVRHRLARPLQCAARFSAARFSAARLTPLCSSTSHCSAPAPTGDMLAQVGADAPD